MHAWSSIFHERESYSWTYTHPWWPYHQSLCSKPTSEGWSNSKVEDGHLWIEARAYIQKWRIDKSPAGLGPICLSKYIRQYLIAWIVCDSEWRSNAYPCRSSWTMQHINVLAPKLRSWSVVYCCTRLGRLFQSMDGYCHWQILLPVSWTKIHGHHGWSGPINIERGGGDEGYSKAWNKRLGSLDTAERDSSPSVEHIVPSMDWGRFGSQPALDRLEIVETANLQYRPLGCSKTHGDVVRLCRVKARWATNSFCILSPVLQTVQCS